jgi:hypothetical protein
MKKSLLLLFLLSNIIQAQLIISENTVWSTDQILTQSVIVNEGATLTIEKGVSVKPLFIDINSDNIGDINIEIKGNLVLNSTISEPTIFEPYESTFSNRYWEGITINTDSLVLLRNFYIYNANKGLNIFSPIIVENFTSLSCGEYGISIATNSPIPCQFNNINIQDGVGFGMGITSQSNVEIKWANIDNNKADGIYINDNSEGIFTNLVLANNEGSGIRIDSSNSVQISKSRMHANKKYGLFIGHSNFNGEYLEIDNNDLSGMVVWGGNNDVNLSYSTILQNGGSAIDITDWHSTLYPNLIVSNCNFIDNFNSTIEIPLVDSQFPFDITTPRIGDIYDGECYYTNNYPSGPSSGIGETPVGRLYKIQPTCWLGNEDAPNRYFLIDDVQDKVIWQHMLSPTMVPKNECKLNRQSGDSLEIGSDKWYFKTNNLLGGQSTTGIMLESQSTNGHPTILKLGGFEIFSLINKNITYNFKNNFWNRINNLDKLFYEVEYPNQIDYSGFQVTQIEDATSLLSNEKKITINSPIQGQSYQVNNDIVINWNSEGFIPLVDVLVSKDLGSTWEYVFEGIANNDTANYLVNLEANTIAYIKIQDTKDNTIFSQVGPIFITENTTPKLGISLTELNFASSIKDSSFIIKNIGGGDLNWTINSTNDWLNISPNEGITQEETLVSVSISRNYLETGTYYDTVQIVSNGGNEQLYVSMVVTAQLNIFQTLVDFDSIKTSIPVILENIGGGQITWNGTPNKEWITLSKSSNTFWSYDTVYVTVNRESLSVGEYNGQLVISSDYGSKNLNISMIVSNKPNLLINYFTGYQRLGTNLQLSDENILFWSIDSNLVENTDTLEYYIYRKENSSNYELLAKTEFQYFKDGPLTLTNTYYYYIIAQGSSLQYLPSEIITIKMDNNKLVSLPYLQDFENETTYWKASQAEGEGLVEDGLYFWHVTNDTNLVLDDNKSLVLFSRYSNRSGVLYSPKFNFNMIGPTSFIIKFNYNYSCLSSSTTRNFSLIANDKTIYSKNLECITNFNEEVSISISATSLPSDKQLIFRFEFEGLADAILTIDNFSIDLPTNLESEIIPSQYSLDQNYPNPFNPSTIINYGIPEESNVRLSIYSILGEEIAELINTQQKAGYYDIKWNAGNLSSGIYFVRISANSVLSNKNFINTKKMLLVK